MCLAIGIFAAWNLIHRAQTSAWLIQDRLSKEVQLPLDPKIQNQAKILLGELRDLRQEMTELYNLF